MSGGKEKRPWLALVLSAVVPGLGQIYNGDFAKGFLLLALNFLIGFLNKDLVKAVMEKQLAEEDRAVFLAYMLAGFLLTVFAVIDAKMSADKINKKIRSKN